MKISYPVFLSSLGASQLQACPFSPFFARRSPISMSSMTSVGLILIQGDERRTSWTAVVGLPVAAGPDQGLGSLDRSVSSHIARCG